MPTAAVEAPNKFGTKQQCFDDGCLYSDPKNKPCRQLTRGGWLWAVQWYGNRLVTGESDVELTVLRQVECLADSLRELTVTIRPWLHLEAVGAAIKVDIHDCRGVGPTLRGESPFPVW